MLPLATTACLGAGLAAARRQAARVARPFRFQTAPIAETPNSGRPSRQLHVTSLADAFNGSHGAN